MRSRRCDTKLICDGIDGTRNLTQRVAMVTFCWFFGRKPKLPTHFDSVPAAPGAPKIQREMLRFSIVWWLRRLGKSAPEDRLPKM